MAQTVQILRTTTNNPPPTLLPGALSVELGTQTKLWVGSAGGNRLLMSSDPADIALSSGCVVAATPPSNPIPGLLWWDSTGGQLYVRYQDVNSTAWVAAASATGNFLPISGGTLTGPLILAADPAVPLGAATKQYADAKLALAGGTMTGPLVLAGPPTAALNPATKAYVDAADVAALNNVGRNLIHNPLFNIQQRGAGPWTPNGSYTADRWVQWFVNGSMSTQINGIGSPIPVSSVGDDAMQRVLYTVFTGGAAAGDLCLLQQAMEGVQRLAGKTVTLSFWAATNGANLKIGANFEQNFGTGGSPSTAIQGTGQSITANTTYTRYSMTFNIPSVSGKTLGTAGNDCMKLNFWLSAGSNNATSSGSVGVQSGGIAFWGVQLEIGSTMTPLEKLDPQQDLANCQRFYQATNTLAQGYNGAGATIYVPISLPGGSMRAIPTVAFSGVSSSNCSLTSLTGNGQNWVQAAVQITAAGYGYVGFTYTASADL